MNRDIQTRNLLSIITSGFIILLPFLYEHKNIFMDGNDIALITLVFTTVFLAIAGIFIHDRKISITTTDIACTAYLLYGTINILVKRGLDFDHFLVARWGALVISYILFRMLMETDLYRGP